MRFAERSTRRPSGGASSGTSSRNGLNPEKSAEAAALTRRIEELWDEMRIAKAYIRYGPSDEIIHRARAHDRLDREARRLRTAA